MPGRTNWPLLTQGSLVLSNKIVNFCLHYKNISMKSVVYNCQQAQLIYEIRYVQNDNKYTDIKSIIEEGKK